MQRGKLPHFVDLDREALRLLAQMRDQGTDAFESAFSPAGLP
jgi:hypothetical protein